MLDLISGIIVGYLIKYLLDKKKMNMYDVVDKSLLSALIARSPHDMTIIEDGKVVYNKTTYFPLHG